MGIFAWRILLDKEWILNPSEWSLGRDDPTVAPDLKFFYLLYAAKYASEVVTLYFEHLRSVRSFCCGALHQERAHQP